MSLQALIFDVDGTLADTEQEGHRPAFNAAFAAAGLPWHWNETDYGKLLAVAGGLERLRHYVGRRHPEFLERQGADEALRRLHEDKSRRYLAMATAGRIPLRPGVADLIREALAARVRLAIATTTGPANVTALLRAALDPAAPSWFEVIGAGDAVARKKPAPDIYRWVLQGLALPAAACLAVEDSALGLRAALGAGLPTVVVENAQSRGQDFRGALAVLPDFSGLTLDRLQSLHKHLSLPS